MSKSQLALHEEPIADALTVTSWTCSIRTALFEYSSLVRLFSVLPNAILAISARQMERTEGIQVPFDSLNFYQESIRFLSLLLQMRDPKVDVTCVLLWCLEMMPASAQD